MQLQNNSVNGAMLITINRVITHVITTNISQNERQNILVVISVALMEAEILKWIILCLVLF